MPKPRFVPNDFRPYSKQDVEKLRGSYQIEHTLAKLGSERLWQLLNEKPYVKALGCMSGNAAVQMVKAGLDAIYISGWQAAADVNLSGQTYPDQSLYPSNSVPALVKRINNALLRADQIEHAEGKVSRNWLVPLIADAEAGFGGPLNSFELMKSMIEASAAAVHFEDQTALFKRCGHLGKKVLISTKSFIKHLTAARLASDVMDVPTLLIARTDGESGSWITDDSDERDHRFIDHDVRSDDGFYKLIGDPVERCVARALAYAPFSDMLWMETSHPDLGEAKAFADGVHEKYPGKMLAYNLSPSFNWKKNLSDKGIAEFQDRLGELGFCYQFITLANFHSSNMAMFELASGFRERNMSAYIDLQQKEFAWEEFGYTAVKHQREISTGYFDQVRQVIDGNSDMSALAQSTENRQF